MNLDAVSHDDPSLQMDASAETSDATSIVQTHDDASLKRDIGIVFPPGPVEVVSIDSFKRCLQQDKLWFTNPGDMIECDRCGNTVPKSPGALMFSLCSECFIAVHGGEA